MSLMKQEWDQDRTEHINLKKAKHVQGCMSLETPGFPWSIIEQGIACNIYKVRSDVMAASGSLLDQ